MNDLAPVILFVYNRPFHTNKTFIALKNNILAKESNLFIFSDGSKNESDVKLVKQVRDIIHTFDGFKKIKIIEQEKNLGLANSVIIGVSEVIKKYGKAIVIEDDLISSKYMLKYLNEALVYYKNMEEVFSISAYNHPQSIMKFPVNYNKDIYFVKRAPSWGWATWANRWDKADWSVGDYNQFVNNRKMIKQFQLGGVDLVDLLKAQMEGKVNSWLIRWNYTYLKHNGYSVYPVKSYINNIGYDGTGVHCGVADLSPNNLELAKENISFLDNLIVDDKVFKEFKKVYQRKWKYYIQKILLYKYWKNLITYSKKDTFSI